MPKGYAIFTLKVHDEDGLGAYFEAALPTMFEAGGNLIVAGPPAEVLEGDWRGDRTAILEFPSLEAAHRWYRSSEYQNVIGKRHAAAESNAVIIGGFEMPTNAPSEEQR
jgi:uncharacterized protein (DUF1330 family)